MAFASPIGTSLDARHMVRQFHLIGLKMDTYSHLMPESKREAADLKDRILTAGD